MRGGLRRLLTASIVVAVVLATPTAALAGNGSGCSACKVYVEQQQSAGGSQPTNQSGGTTTAQKPAHVSKKADHSLEHAGKDQKVLHSLVTNPAYGRKRGLQSTGGSSSVATPSAVSAAVDLGSGPTALLAALAGSVLLLLALGGFRGWRRWRSGPASPPG